ncbi:MAG: Error-prone repair protein ImuA [Crocinitomicaceae bacterium]|nr:MAG: Error-prone repair protein ImuA [Crocinitomicaceae bacterium]
MKRSSKQAIVQELRTRILAMQGINKPGNGSRSIGLGDIEKAFPGSVFPKNAIHEFTSHEPESAAATSGFLSCLLHSMTNRKGFCLWVSSRRVIFPPALKLLGIDPECVIFVDLQNDKDVLWAIEEGLRCSALIAVVGELRELTFAQSRRLQLTIEESQVSGFIHRVLPKSENATVCAARWKISPLPGMIEPGLPGIGFPKWRVELAKVKNGKPGSWELAWTPKGFEHFSKKTSETDNNPNTAQYA